MEYQVKLTDYAVEQLQEIVSYISNVLQSPETARRWLERVKLEISSLRTMLGGGCGSVKCGFRVKKGGIH